MSIRFTLGFLATTLAFLGAALLLLGGTRDEGWLALTLGVGLGTMTALSWRWTASRVRADIVLGTTLVAFVIAQAIRLVATGTVDAADVIAIGAEALIIGVALLLVRAQLFGIGRVLTLLAQPTHDAGYARLLSVPEATGFVEAELARSRRRNEPLTSLALIASRESTSTRPASYRSLGLDSVRFLEEFYVRARLAGLLTQHARRSDFVVRAPNGTCFVVGPGTDASGALAFAHRVATAAESELGLALQFGISSFPADGECFADLMAVASERARSAAKALDVDRPTIVEARPSEPTPTPAQALSQ